MDTKENIPRMYGAIVLIFPSRNFKSSVIKLFPSHVESTEYPDFVEVVYKMLDNVYSWEIDDLLTQLFIDCDWDLLDNLISNYSARILIDISFHHYSKYPSLVFEGDNMQIIHKLRADISIDAY